LSKFMQAQRNDDPEGVSGNWDLPKKELANGI
jgi:hypothetical protein